MSYHQNNNSVPPYIMHSCSGQFDFHFLPLPTPARCPGKAFCPLLFDRDLQIKWIATWLSNVLMFQKERNLSPVQKSPVLFRGKKSGDCTNCGNTTEATTLPQEFFKKKKRKLSGESRSLTHTPPFCSLYLSNAFCFLTVFESNFLYPPCQLGMKRPGTMDSSPSHSSCRNYFLFTFLSFFFFPAFLAAPPLRFQIFFEFCCGGFFFTLRQCLIQEFRFQDWGVSCFCAQKFFSPADQGHWELYFFFAEQKKSNKWRRRRKKI